MATPHKRKTENPALSDVTAENDNNDTAENLPSAGVKFVDHPPGDNVNTDFLEGKSNE